MLHNEPEDINTIIRGCRNNDRKAQEQLYRSFYRVMMSLCLRYTKNETDAVEVLNTGFYKVYRHIDRYDAKKGTVYTWIRTIIVRSCLDFIRGRGIQPTLELEEESDSLEISPEVIGKLSAAAILELVRQLPPATQAVFNLYVMEGYNHREIAAGLGISEGTSKWHLSEARKKLQSLIIKQESAS